MRFRPAASRFTFVLVFTATALSAQNLSQMKPYSLDDPAAAQASSPMDVSFLLEAPAGKHGFIHAVDGHLVDGTGRTIRLWGVNITDWGPGSQQIPAKKYAAYWAATLARFGVNCVRFQFLDLRAPRGLISNRQANTQALDPVQLNREDYFIAQLEKRGIYIDFNLLVGRPFSSADGVADAGKLGQGAKGTSLFDARLIALQKQYAQELLAHKNPYTGRKYVDDPGVALVEINNENAIEIGYRAPSPFYLKELTQMYNAWLTNHRTPEQIDHLRQITDVKGNDPVPLMQSSWQPPSAPSARYYAETEFYNYVQHSYFTEMYDYLKNTLGLKSLVIATADHAHLHSGYPMLKATASMPVIDGHDYWEHPDKYVRKSAMVNDPLHSTVVKLSRSAIAGKPYTVSEVNEPFPNNYDSEQIPVLASYGLLQNWSAIIWYTFEPRADPHWKPYIGGPFDISQDPVKMAELAEGALVFLGGDIEPAHTVKLRSYTAKQVYDSIILPAATQAPYFTPGFPLYLPLEDEVRISSFNGPPTQEFNDMPVPNPIVSDTGQLAWYTSPHHGGLVTIDAPRTQGLVGFVRANSKAVSHLKADVTNKFCTLWLTSMDGKPISQSSRMMLVAAGAVENSGERWNTADTALTRWGGPPTLINQVTGTLTLLQLGDARTVLLQPMNGAGQPDGSAIPAKKVAGGWVLTLGNPVTPWYEVTVQR